MVKEFSEDRLRENNEKMADPMPILPKVFDRFLFPPKCPLQKITFIQNRKLTRFAEESKAKLGEGYDQVDSGSAHRRRLKKQHENLQSPSKRNRDES